MLQVANSCKAKGAASCDIHAVDLSQADAVEGFAKAVLSKHKQVDVLVNNAGMGTDGQHSGPLEGKESNQFIPPDRHEGDLACN